MSHPSDKSDPTVMVSIPAPLLPLVERLNTLMQEVRDMPRGGDLEGLILTHLDGLRRESCQVALQERQDAAALQASDPAGAFPPSDVPALPESAAPWPPQAAHDPEPAR